MAVPPQTNVLITAARLLRVQQWPKNLLVLMPLVFAQEIGMTNAVVAAATALAAFCLVSSATYVFNDLRDLAQDREHPVKRNRPLASGTAPARIAWPVIIALLAAGLALAGSLGPGFSAVVGAYLVLTLSYTLLLKHVFLVDALCVALGFVVRAMAGAVAINVTFSNWLVVCTLFLALFLSFGKRRTEIAVLEEQAAAHRAVLGQYSIAFLDQITLLVASGALITYTIYTCSPEVVTRVGTDKLYLTLPFVVYGLARYLWLIRDRQIGGDPSTVLFRDPPTLINVLLWMAACIVILYTA